MKSKGLKITLLVLLIIIAAYLVGPRAEKPTFDPTMPVIELACQDVANYVMAAESNLNIRSGNSSIVYYANDTAPSPTEFVLLYLHGFSASPREGGPIHLTLAREFAMNAYIPRLFAHGLQTDEALLDMHPDSLWESAKQALEVAGKLGKKVIVMGTSTGATLALKLAADYPEKVHSLILYAPNIRIANKATALLSKPWGLQIGRMVMGGKYRVLEGDPKTDPYWYTTYRVEGIVYLQQLVETTMQAKLFKAVRQPVFIGYYYKDEEHQDDVVSIPAIDWMYENLSTPKDTKISMAFGDASEHVIACDLTNDNWMNVLTSTKSFLQMVGLSY